MAGAVDSKPKRQALRPKHVPLRTCVACRTKGPKADFARVVRTPEGEVVVEPARQVPGRGAYICKRIACWETAIDKGRLVHTLKGPIPPAAGAALLAEARERYGKQE
ncbi:MAG: YlxR family protein [Chloroflexi bacterium]|nr:YlxR family protein [Chloroflexota bacterium]